MISFDKIPKSKEWSFNNIRSTNQWTHGYHRYPAKFIPNIVKKIIEEYTNPSDIIVDFFAGCGTTLVEAKIHGRKSIGIDINPLSELIVKAKITPIEPLEIEIVFKNLLNSFFDYSEQSFIKYPLHERIDYWFYPKEKNKIAFMLKKILEIDNQEQKIFMMVSLSHILKNCSKWLQSSTKPQVDKNKKIVDPFILFERHTKKMINSNNKYYQYLKDNNKLNTKCEIRIEDARKTSLRSNSVSTIITSPPYVTSYEYADIHQLTSYWFNYFTNIQEFRKNFIGTSYSPNKEIEVESKIALEIMNKLKKKDKKKAKDVANYFHDIHLVVLEMKRVIKTNGYICIVIGNTFYKGVKIKSAEVFLEELEALGFDIDKIIRRNIKNKLIPTIRDKNTGKFSTLANINSKLIYPDEYIIFARKV